MNSELRFWEKLLSPQLKKKVLGNKRRVQCDRSKSIHTLNGKVRPVAVHSSCKRMLVMPTRNAGQLYSGTLQSVPHNVLHSMPHNVPHPRARLATFPTRTRSGMSTVDAGTLAEDFRALRGTFDEYQLAYYQSGATTGRSQRRKLSGKLLYL